MKDIHLHLVDVIEGIGRRIGTILEENDVFTLVDLIRIPVSHLHAHVRAKSSIEQVEQWVSMAGLLQVRDLDPQTAEALVRANIHSLQMLYFQSIPRLTKILKEAKDEGVIPSVIDTETVANIRTDAAALYFSGTLLGRKGASLANPEAF